MGKVIKIIDLLNMIAKGERLPKKIKYNEIEFYSSENMQYYSYFNEEDCITENIMDYISCCDLNDKVEILDEEDEIDIQSIEELPDCNFSIKGNRDKINELIKVIKQLDNKINKLESEG